MRFILGFSALISIALLSRIEVYGQSTRLTPTTKSIGASTQPAMKDKAQHEDFLKIAKAGSIDLVFFGDSITDEFRSKGKADWDSYFIPLKAANFGGSIGDRTEHLIWRLVNGELEGYQAKLFVLLIGTNNLWRDDNDQVEDGIKLCVKLIKEKQPRAKILLLGILPRDEQAESPYRSRIKSINADLSKLQDGTKVNFLDIGSKFLTDKGILTKEIMPDGLHLSEKGYQIWATSIIDKVRELMK
jgi:lysophospholipase L1-like esterase